MGVTVKTRGGVRVRRRLDRIARNVEENVNDAVGDAGEDLLRHALERTPMSAGTDEDGHAGALRRSGYADHSVPGRVNVGFSSDIAYYVHEMGLEVYPERAPINWTTPGTGAKFLEAPFLANRKRYGEEIKEAARRGVRSG